MGFFDAKLTKYSTLSPEQEQLSSTLGPRLTALANQGPSASTYSGQLTSPITDLEQGNIEQASRFGAVAGQSLSNLSNYNDANFNEQFNSEIADPTYSNFKRNIQPGIEEALPTFSTARGAAVARGLQDTSDALMEQRFAAREAAKNRAIQAATAGAQFYQTQAGTLAIPREIAQAGLDREFANFYTGQKQYQEGINSMLGYLGIQTQGYVNEGSTYDKVLAGLNTAANVYSSLSGSQTKKLSEAATYAG